MKNCRNYIRIIKPVLIICLWCCSLTLFAQLPQVKTSVDKNSILIGQQINLHIETSMPDNTYRLTWFSVPDSFGNFVPVIQNKIDTTYANQKWNFTQNVVITSFDSGRQVIPPLMFTASTLQGDSTFNFYTDSIPVNVGYAPADSILPFHDIKNIIEVKKEIPWWVWALIALGAIIIIFLILFLFKVFKKKKVEETVFESKLSPYAEAMKLLDDLQKENLVQNNKLKEYHIRLTEILKRYLSRMDKVYQMHLTTDETLIKLKDTGVPKEQVGEFANSLRMSDAVKFAKFTPPAFENEKCFEQTKEIIDTLNKIVNEKGKDDI